MRKASGPPTASHALQKLRRRPAVERVLHDARALAALDLPRQLAAELEVQAQVVDRPALVVAHEDAVVGVGDELLERRRPARIGLERHVDHADDRHAIPRLGAQAAARAGQPEPRRRLARRQVADELSARDERRLARRHAFVVPAEAAERARRGGVGASGSRAASRSESGPADRARGTTRRRATPRRRTRDRSRSGGRTTRGSAAPAAACRG